MPMLIFVSGLFCKREKTSRYVLFYISCGFLLKVSITILYALVNKNYGFGFTSDLGVPWFVFVLATYYCILYLF